MTFTVYAILLGVLAAVLAATVKGPQENRLSDRDFWTLVVSLSEPEQPFHPTGDYESDNLVSNERSFQHVLPNLVKRPNGAYIGVGPEQNFTYVAFLEPRIAFIIDIRRANLLEHLLYKALFELSADRSEFLSRLFGRERRPTRSAALTASELLLDLRATRSSNAAANHTFRQVIDRLVHLHGFMLSAADVDGMRAIYARFCADGPDLRWSPDRRDWIPTYAELMVERGGDGLQHGFLASEERFRAVKAAEQANRVVPIVGDFGGSRALRGIARYLVAHHLIVDAFYTSNVEPYLRGDAVDRFESNLAALPADSQSVLVRTTFHWTGGSPSKPDYTTSTAAVPLRR